MPWGVDECLLPALSVGAKGAVGSTYNFAAKIYQRLWKDFLRDDLAAARKEQLRSIQLIDLLSEFGYMAAAKAMMGFLGVEVGPPRLPNSQLSPTGQNQLREALDRLGAFDWVK
jgi:N-acetylneuraminate lyase